MRTTALARNRSRFLYKTTYAFRHPGRIWPYTRRWVRNLKLSVHAEGHVAYYRGVMRSDAARSARAAVGSKTNEAWLRNGQMQFDYLRSHGLEPGMRMLAGTTCGAPPTPEDNEADPRMVRCSATAS